MIYLYSIIEGLFFTDFFSHSHGAYEELPKVREKLLLYAKEHNLTPLGMCRHTYLEGPPQHKDKKLFITQVALPIEE